MSTSSLDQNGLSLAKLVSKFEARKGKLDRAAPLQGLIEVPVTREVQ